MIADGFGAAEAEYCVRIGRAAPAGRTDLTLDEALDRADDQLEDWLETTDDQLEDWLEATDDQLEDSLAVLEA